MLTVHSPHCRVKSKRQLYVLPIFGFLRPSHCLSHKKHLINIWWTVVCCFCIYGYKWNITSRSFHVLFKSLGFVAVAFTYRSSGVLCSTFFSVLVLFYWSIVDLQCCVNICCTAKWFSYIIYMHIYIYIYIYIYILFLKYSFPLWFIIGYWI